MELEYLIIYKNDGIPIYANCFAEVCKTAIKEPILFSAFLASLNQFAKYDPENVPKSLDMNGIPLTVDFNPVSGVNSVQLEELQLMFLYSEINDITIAAGFNSFKFDKQNAIPVFQSFLNETEHFLRNYLTTNWNNVSRDFLIGFESDLLTIVIHPFFEKHNIKDTCFLGEKCPFRVAIYEERGSIFDRLRNTVQKYRGFNFIQKWKTILLKPKYPLQS